MVSSRHSGSSTMAQTAFYEALRANFTQVIPHSRECGMVIDLIDPQGATASLPYRPEWLGDTERGLIHTGIITTLVDTVSGLAALAAAGRFEPMPTLDLRMDYLRPALPDKALHARAECYRLTRSIAFVRARAWQDDEQEPVAVSQSTFMRGSPMKRAALTGKVT
jgi:uncharacterized protein (TIGR00369 family)